MPLQASTPAIHTQGSLRGGVPPLNGGGWGGTPQIRVLPPLGQSKLTVIWRLPLRLVQQLTNLYPKLTLISEK